MKSLRLVLTAVTLAAIVTTLPHPAGAQTDLTDLETAIQRNAELLHQARELVSETNSTKARTSLRASALLHEQSLKLVEEGARPALILRVVSETRQSILKTISIAKQEAKLEENAHKSIERATIRLEQARTAVEDDGARDDVASRRLLEEAHQQLNLARNHMREHLFGIALQLANSSAELSMRAMRLTRRDAASPEDVARALDRTDEVIQRAADSEGVWAQPQAEKRLRDAEDMQAKARRSATDRDYRIAMDQTRRARSIVLRMLRHDRGDNGVDPENVERALRLTDRILTRATELATEQSADEALARLDEAVRLQQLAKEHLGSGRPRPALKTTERARDIARRAMESVEKPLDRDTVAAAVEQTETTIAQLAERLQTSDDGEAIELHKRASARQRDALKALSANQLRRAMSMTRVARKLGLRGLRITENANR